ncbi:hypothetical protein Q9189_001809 [Teloschistes chrysophthalmus]
MSLIFIICTLLVHVLALPSIPHHPPSGLDITHQIAKRADSPKSARLKASLIPNTHFFVTTLNVNGKNVSMLIDTGSADFWLSGPKAPSAKGEPGAKLVPGEKFNITYGHSDAYVSGVAVSTTVKLGHLSVKDFTLGVATKNGYADKVTDGIMGLGFKNQNEMRPTQQPTLMMVVQQQLQQPVFTLNLKSDASGEIEFGLVDHSKHKGNLVEAKVNNITDPYWTIDAMTLSSGTAKVTQRMVFATLFERETYLNQDARATGTSASTTPQAPPWRNACRDHLSRDMAAAMVDPRRVASAKDAFSYV